VLGLERLSLVTSKLGLTKAMFIKPHFLQNPDIMSMCVYLPATFTRAMKAVLMGLLGYVHIAYHNDIVVYGSSLRNHQKKLIRVVNRLRVHDLIHPEK